MKRLLVLALPFLFCGQALAQSISDRIDSSQTSAQEQREKKEATLPKCDRAMGTVAIAEPKENWWNQAKLQSPEALIKMYVNKSGCFTVVDRGRGFEIAARERALAAGGTLQAGSNIGSGQMKAADYVITPDIVMAAKNTGGNAVGAILGGILGSFIPGAGLIASQISLNDSSAEVTLAVTDVRTSEQWSTNGKASKTDMSFGVGGGAFMGGGFGAAGVGSYENTPTGQVAALAYLEAYTQMVERIRATQLAPAPVAETPPPPQEPVVAPVPPPPVQKAAAVSRPKPIATAKKGTLYSSPSAKSEKVREVPPGTILYPTTNTSGPWREVEDDSGNMGWIPVGVLQLGQ